MGSTVLWIVLAVACIIVEACTYQMISTWFAIGAAVAAVLSSADVTVAWQIAVFLIVSVACLCALRPLSMKLLKGKYTQTNAESLIGESVLITEDVDNIQFLGKGKVRGMEWSVRSEDGNAIPAGSSAYIKKIEGVKLIVSMKGE